MTFNKFSLDANASASSMKSMTILVRLMSCRAWVVAAMRASAVLQSTSMREPAANSSYRTRVNLWRSLLASMSPTSWLNNCGPQTKNIIGLF